MRGLARWVLPLLVGAACGGEATTASSEPAGTSGVAAGGAAGGAPGAGPSGTGGAAGGGAGTAGASSGTAGAPPVDCPETPLSPGVHQRTLKFMDLERAYEVQIPGGYDNQSAVPLVFDAHGFTSNKDQQELVSGFKDKAEGEGFVVVRPDGHMASWNGGDHCCGAAQSQGLDDVGLMKAIAAEVQTLACIDPRRIYATGISNGGALSHRIACEAADVFAAVAPVAYPLGFDPFDKCKPSRPIGVLHAHGTGDLIVPYNGGGLSQAAPTPESFAYWAKTNGCTGMPVESYKKGKSHCDSFESCAGGVTVTLCSVDGGHVLYTNNDQIPIADLAWEFLKKHTLP
jgi:polyhydroxybutyrate depolymerase